MKQRNTRTFKALTVSFSILMFAGCAKKNPFVNHVEPSIHWEDKDEEKENEDVQKEESKTSPTETVINTKGTIIEPGEVEFDRIEAIVEGPQEIEKISTSDIKRRGFDGGNHTLDDIIDERLRDQRGIELKIDVTDDDINKYLMQLSNGAPMSKEYLSNVARAHGYTLDEFYDELKRLYRSNQVLDYDVHSRMEIPDEDINQYHEKNPIMEEEVYYIQTTYVPYEENKTEEALLKELKDPVKRSKRNLEWTIPVDLKLSDIEESQAFIREMKKGDIHVVQDYDGFTIYKVHDFVPPRAQKLEIRKQEILNELRQKKFYELIEELKKDLRKQAHVYYLNDKSEDFTKN